MMRLIRINKDFHLLFGPPELCVKKQDLGFFIFLISSSSAIKCDIDLFSLNKNPYFITLHKSSFVR